MVKKHSNVDAPWYAYTVCNHSSPCRRRVDSDMHAIYHIRVGFWLLVSLCGAISGPWCAGRVIQVLRFFILWREMYAIKCNLKRLPNLGTYRRNKFFCRNGKEKQKRGAAVAPSVLQESGSNRSSNRRCCGNGKCTRHRKSIRSSYGLQL